jgi:hypothetical protein
VPGSKPGTSDYAIYEYQRRRGDTRILQGFGGEGSGDWSTFDAFP